MQTRPWDVPQKIVAVRLETRADCEKQLTLCENICSFLSSRLRSLTSEKMPQRRQIILQMLVFRSFVPLSLILLSRAAEMTRRATLEVYMHIPEQSEQ